MNHNYFIILFLAIFLIQVEKIHGGYRPVGEGDQTSGGSEIQKVTFSSGKITVTTNIEEKDQNGNNKHTEGIGHFTFNYNDANGKHVEVRINKAAELVNNHDCSGNVDPNEVNPFTKIWKFDSAVTPPSGTDVAVYLSIYWDCMVAPKVMVE